MSLEPPPHVPGTGRWSARASLLDGALAGSISLAILLGTHLFLGRGGFLAAVADGFTRFVPLDLFEKGIQLLGPGAKSLVFAGVCAGVVFAGALLGRPLSRIRFGWWALDGLVAGAVAVVAAEAGVLPLFGAGIAGSSLVADPVALHLPLALAGAAYGLALAALRDSHLVRSAAAGSSAQAFETPPDAAAWQHDSGVPRRTFLGRALAVLGGASLIGSAVAMVREFTLIATPVNAGPRPSPAGPVGSPLSGGLPGASVAGDPFGPTPARTPLDQFYVVQKNFISPRVDGGSWRLKVDGLVSTPHEWTMSELRALVSVGGPRTLSCISNDVPAGGSLIGNQEWRGARLNDVLDRAGVAPAASWILWEAADGYTESLPLEVARSRDIWLVYEMGGLPLTDDHGFPLRVMIPGRFGMKQPKWLTRIQLADHDQQGYWEQRGWDEEAFVLNMSRIDFPNNGATVRAATPLPVSGIAYAGDRGIAKVELSPDDGASWLAAALDDATQDPLGPLTWVRWRADVSLPAAAAGSTLRLVVRATSQDGTVQDGTKRMSLPSGATGWHAIRVVVTA